MTALHKPERTTYGQAIEAQHDEHNFIDCDDVNIICLGNTGEYRCCK